MYLISQPGCLGRRIILLQELALKISPCGDGIAGKQVQPCRGSACECEREQPKVNGLVCNAIDAKRIAYAYKKGEMARSILILKSVELQSS